MVGRPGLAGAKTISAQAGAGTVAELGNKLKSQNEPRAKNNKVLTQNLCVMDILLSSGSMFIKVSLALVRYSNTLSY